MEMGLRTSPSSQSLNSLLDPPPPYQDQHPAEPSSDTARLLNSSYELPGGSGTTAQQASDVTLAASLSSDSEALLRLLRQQMRLPPRPILSVCGSHTKTTDEGKKSSKEETIVDFRFALDLAETMLTGWEGRMPRKDTSNNNDDDNDDNNNNWVAVDIVRDGDERAAYRGGNLRSRSYKPPKATTNKTSSSLPESETALLADGEENDGEQGEMDPDLMLWCERFCADPSPIKSFTLHRTLDGFDEDAFRKRLASHLRALNYLGTVQLSLSLAHRSVTIYSPHWINRLRRNRWVWFACVVLQLWIITWPVIWLLERRYEVLSTAWHASLDPAESDAGAWMGAGPARRYARGLDETTLADYWGPAVMQAAWNRSSDHQVLTRLDANRLQGVRTEQLLGLTTGSSGGSAADYGRDITGEASVVHNVEHVIRGLGRVRQGYRLEMGWGENC